MALWKELKKILRQMQGKENIFGYKSTEANQLYLLYCLNGKIYFTDKIHLRVKLLWLIPLMLETWVCYFAIITNLWYNSKKDAMMLFDTINLLGVCNMGVFIIPFISYWYRENIESMIKGVDEVIASRSRSYENYKNIQNVKEVFLFNVGAFCAIFIVTFLYLFDVVIYFESWKIENRYYYTTSVSLTEQFRSEKNYIIFNSLMTIVIVQLFSRCALPLFFMIFWSLMCHNELIHLENEINVLSNDLSACIGHQGNPSAGWNRHFSKGLTRSIKRFQKIIKIIDDFRGFYQVICAISIPTSFFVIVAQLLVILTGNFSFILKCRQIGYCLSVGWSNFQMYWAAQRLQISVYELSLAVYSTPWYKSTGPRKNVYIFLCQTEKLEPLKIIKVHSLLMQNFSRYLNGILSVTNAIRKLTVK